VAALVVDAAGPDEHRWVDRIARLPRWPVPSGAHLVVVSPHPDDETLGVGGLLQLVRATGGRVDLLAVTDGEASHPGVAGLAERRRRELREALGHLGVADMTTVHHLGVPDGEVADHEHVVTEAVRQRATGDAIVLGPHPADGHADHEAAGRAVAAATPHLASPPLAYPVWAWHWHDPDRTSLLDAAWRIPLPPAAVSRKRRAALAHRSQLSDDLGDPIVPAHVLQRLLRDDEVVVACA
jgi:LmbE family N-acetylglucosaminyl deacetylase